MKALTVFVVGLALVGNCNRQVDGEVIVESNTTIDYTIDDSLRVIEGSNPTPPTVLYIVSPASIASVSVWDSSIVDFTGASIDRGLVAHDSSTVNVSGGLLQGSLTARDSSTVNVYGGNLKNTGAHAYGSGMLNIYGGDLDAVYAYDRSVVNIRGGSISALGGLWASGDSAFNLYGYDLQITNHQLRGTWADGNPIPYYIMVFQFDNGQFLLHQVPEPATGTSVCALVTAVLLACLARRRR